MTSELFTPSGCIERHVDQEQLAVLRAAEGSERETLGCWAGIITGDASNSSQSPEVRP